jgi:hypothetical protein
LGNILFKKYPIPQRDSISQPKCGSSLRRQRRYL